MTKRADTTLLAIARAVELPHHPRFDSEVLQRTNIKANRGRTKRQGLHVLR